MTARVIAVVGPSGAGKDTLMRDVAAARPDVHLIRRVITRPADAATEDFQSVTPAEFARMRAQGLFAIDWQAHGLCYAVPRVPAEADGVRLVNLSRAVLQQADRAFPGLSVIHVSAAPEVLALRLSARGRETDQQIAARTSRAATFSAGDLPVAFIDNSGDLQAAITAFLAALDEVVTS